VVWILSHTVLLGEGIVARLMSIVLNMKNSPVCGPTLTEDS
jgi:hypothetical protein